MGRSIMIIDDGVIRHKFHPKPKVGPSLYELQEELRENWLGCFEVGRDQAGKPMYGPKEPPYIRIEDPLERALCREKFYDPFSNVICWKKMLEFMGSLPVALRNKDWEPEGPQEFSEVECDNNWHINMEITSDGGLKYKRGYKTKKTKRMMSGKFTTNDVMDFEFFY